MHCPPAGGSARGPNGLVTRLPATLTPGRERRRMGTYCRQDGFRCHLAALDPTNHRHTASTRGDGLARLRWGVGAAEAHAPRPRRQRAFVEALEAEGAPLRRERSGGLTSTKPRRAQTSSHSAAPDDQRDLHARPVWPGRHRHTTCAPTVLRFASGCITRRRVWAEPQRGWRSAMGDDWHHVTLVQPALHPSLMRAIPASTVALLAALPAAVRIARSPIREPSRRSSRPKALAMVEPAGGPSGQPVGPDGRRSSASDLEGGRTARTSVPTRNRFDSRSPRPMHSPRSAARPINSSSNRDGGGWNHGTSPGGLRTASSTASAPPSLRHFIQRNFDFGRRRLGRPSNVR